MNDIRKTSGYRDAVAKIKAYPKGFEFTIKFWQIPTDAKKRGMIFILKDMMNEGIIESIAIDESFESLQTPFPHEEIFVRL